MERLQQTMQKKSKKNIRDYYEQLYGNEIYNLKEMDRFLEKLKTAPRQNRNYEESNYKHSN